MLERGNIFQTRFIQEENNKNCENIGDCLRGIKSINHYHSKDRTNASNLSSLKSSIFFLLRGRLYDKRFSSAISMLNWFIFKMEFFFCLYTSVSHIIPISDQVKIKYIFLVNHGHWFFRQNDLTDSSRKSEIQKLYLSPIRKARL